MIAEDDCVHVIGFVHVGPGDGAPQAIEGEVYALNVDPDVWGHRYREGVARCRH